MNNKCFHSELVISRHFSNLHAASAIHCIGKARRFIYAKDQLKLFFYLILRFLPLLEGRPYPSSFLQNLSKTLTIVNTSVFIICKIPERFTWCCYQQFFPLCIEYNLEGAPGITVSLVIKPCHEPPILTYGCQFPQKNTIRPPEKGFTNINRQYS